MEEKLQSLYKECLAESKSIGIDFSDSKEFGKIDISLSKRKSKRYGCCKQEEPDKRFKKIERRGRHKFVKYDKFNVHHIEISKWVMQLDDEVIKNTIFHELIHCIPFCNNHSKLFKKYAIYLNENLGYNIKTSGNPKEDFEKSNVPYKADEIHYNYKLKCIGCGQEIYRQRFNVKKIKMYRCGKCGGNLQLIDF